MTGLKIMALTALLLAYGVGATHAVSLSNEALSGKRNMETRTRCPVADAEYSPDGRFVITASDRAMIWDAVDYKPIRVLNTEPDYLETASYSPNGQYIATGGDDTILWDAKTGKQIHTLSFGHPRFSPDSHFLITISSDPEFPWIGDISVWDVITGSEVLIFDDAQADGAVYSPDGNFITSFNYLGFTTWEAIRGTQIYTVNLRSVSQVDYSPNGRVILTASEGRVSLWDAMTGAYIRSLNKAAGWIYRARYSPTGRFIVAASHRDDDTYAAIIIDATTYKPITYLAGHTDTIMSAIFSADEKSVLTASRDGTAIIWDTATQHPVYTLDGCAGR